MELERHPLAPQTGKQALIIVDIQDCFIKAINRDILSHVVKNVKLFLALLGKLKLRTIITEQYPDGLGKTLEEIQEALETYEPITKISFSCWGNERFQSKLKNLTRVKEIILTGIETHVCVLQTALDLIANGYKVYLPADATCSRHKLDWETGLKLMDKAGVIVTTTETLIFQLLKKAGTREFKLMSKFLK